MNTISQIQALNKREIEAGVTPSASWHADYRDTAYIYIGGLPFELSEGDIIAIFSQFGEPVHINLVRDKETGKSKGFAFLKYEDQRSTDLAVDNLGGATVMGRILRVDHTRYKRKDDEELGDNTNGFDNEEAESDGKDEKRAARKRSPGVEDRPILPEERELAELMRNHDDDDPMKDYLVKQKQEEVDLAVKKYESGRSKGREHRHRHRHSHRHDRRRRDRSRSESAERESSRHHRSHHRRSPSPSKDTKTTENRRKPRDQRSRSP